MSASVNEIKDGKFTRELSNDEVEEMVEKFVEAALRCEKAGLDGVEIHGAHGYLVSQFLGKKSNRRTDQWGGETIGDRATFLLEIIRRIRARTNKNFLIFVRISPELNDIGIEIDEALQLSSILSEEEIDSLHISVWDIYAQSRFDDDDRKMTQRFAEVVDGRVPLTTCGKIWERERHRRSIFPRSGFNRCRKGWYCPARLARNDFFTRGDCSPSIYKTAFERCCFERGICRLYVQLR